MKSSSQNIRSVIKARFLEFGSSTLYRWFGCLPDGNGFPFFDSKCLTHVDICDQGASAEIKRCWSNICGFPDGRHQTSFVAHLQNHSKVTVTKKYLSHIALIQSRLDCGGFDGESLPGKWLLGRLARCRPLSLGRRWRKVIQKVIWLSLWLFIRHQLGSWIPWPWQFDNSPRSNSQVT